VENLNMNHSKVWEESKARIKTSQPQHAYATVSTQKRIGLELQAPARFRLALLILLDQTTWNRRAVVGLFLFLPLILPKLLNDSYLSFPQFFHNWIFLNLNCFFITQQTHFLFFFV
jgi:hypothetical protein